MLLSLSDSLRPPNAASSSSLAERIFMTDAITTGWGLIAGNGRFPFLVLEGARSQGIEMAVIALKEEASAELESSVKRLHWVSLGELSKAIDLMHKEGVTQAVMAGQVKHSKIFSFDSGPTGNCETLVFLAAQEYGFTDWRSGAGSGGRRAYGWWTRRFF